MSDEQLMLLLLGGLLLSTYTSIRNSHRYVAKEEENIALRKNLDEICHDRETLRRVKLIAEDWAKSSAQYASEDKEGTRLHIASILMGHLLDLFRLEKKP